MRYAGQLDHERKVLRFGARGRPLKPRPGAEELQRPAEGSQRGAHALQERQPQTVAGCERAPQARHATGHHQSVMVADTLHPAEHEIVGKSVHRGGWVAEVGRGGLSCNYRDATWRPTARSPGAGCAGGGEEEEEEEERREIDAPYATRARRPIRSYRHFILESRSVLWRLPREREVVRCRESPKKIDECREHTPHLSPPCYSRLQGRLAETFDAVWKILLMDARRASK